MTIQGNKHSYLLSERDLPFILDVEGAKDRITYEMRKGVLEQVIETGMKKMVKKGLGLETFVTLVESREILVSA